MSDSLKLATFLPYRCVNLAERVSQALSRIYVRQFGIDIPQWRILATLAEHRSLLARDIGRITHMDKVRVSRAVKALQGRELLSREVSPQDSRAAILTLTPEGRDLYQRIAPLAREWEQRLLEPLSQEEREMLFEVFGKLDQRIGEIEQAQE